MKRRDTMRFWLSLLAVLGTLLLLRSPYLSPLLSLPDELRIVVGEQKQLAQSPLFRWVLRQGEALTMRSTPTFLEATAKGAPGEETIDLKLGSLTVRSVNVQVLPERKVYPGGQSIGVKLRSAGIMVVGYKKVPIADGPPVSPAEAASIKVGDRIARIDGQELKEATELTRIVEKAGRSGKTVTLEVMRGTERLTVPIKPVLDSQDNTFKLGLFVRDSAAGVGTFTFYDPEKQTYGALGHVISDLDTNRPIVAGGGAILPSLVTSIDRGEAGKPGAIRAVFPEDGSPLGTIERNSAYGIFGRIAEMPSHLLYSEPIPVALAEDVHEGQAEIRTVIDGQTVERFTIEIEKIVEQKVPTTKSMIIRVTDPRLLEKTGGIVQGMSGSPIIQDGKLVGAVTHVFVNDPTRGYGVLIEWMLQESDRMLGTRLQHTRDKRVESPLFFNAVVLSKYVDHSEEFVRLCPTLLSLR